MASTTTCKADGSDLSANLSLKLAIYFYSCHKPIPKSQGQPLDPIDFVYAHLGFEFFDPCKESKNVRCGKTFFS
jgi:hypothetical protein